MHRSTRGVAAATAVLALALPGLALAADVGPQAAVAHAGAAAPVSVPGTPVRRGHAVPAGWSLVGRPVRLAAGEEPGATLDCGRTRALAGLAATDDGLGLRPATRRYVGHRRVAVTAYGAARQAASGRVVAACAPR
jgi:hypothetical protein